MSTLPQPEALQIALPLEGIASLCARFGVQELSVFGSVLRNDFHPGSDVDFLVLFKDNDVGEWASKYTELEGELSSLIGRKCDVVDRNAVEHSENYLRRRHILTSARRVYVA